MIVFLRETLRSQLMQGSLQAGAASLQETAAGADHLCTAEMERECKKKQTQAVLLPTAFLPSHTTSGILCFGIN